MKRLTLCIDDFGLHAGVNQAVLQLAAAGRVQAVSCQAAGPAWAEGAPQLAALPRPSIDVGLHLDLTDCTADPHAHRSLGGLIAAACTGRLDPRPVRREIEQQLDAFEAALGRPPDHVDGHRHVHQLPVVREQLIEALARRYPGTRPWLRISAPAAREAGRAAAPRGSAVDAFKRWLIGRLGSRALGRLARANGFGHSARLLGVYDFEGDVRHYERLLRGWLMQAAEGDLLMCHPAAGNAPADDPIGDARGREFDVLGGPTFAQALADSGATLAPLSRILADGASG